MPEIAPLRPGDPADLGGYRLTGRLGEGGQGVVYLGESDDGEKVAIKLLRVLFNGDPAARARFARELRASERVAAFCTARVITADLDAEGPFIVSEYIDGPSLRDAVRSGGPLSGEELLRLAVGTATALTAIHHAGIVHRDFKPDNVLLAADGPRVVDFGIARIVDGTTTSQSVGTPAYMAPEQISGGATGPHTDTFSWGATIAFAGSGTAPFDGETIAAILNRVLVYEPDLGYLPEPLQGIVAACLSKDPDGRPTADEILLRLLGRGGQGMASDPAIEHAAEPDGPESAIAPPDALEEGRDAAATGEFPRVAVLTQPPGEDAPTPPPPSPSRGGPKRGKAWRWVLPSALAAAVAVVVAAVMILRPFDSRGGPGETEKPPPEKVSIVAKARKTGRLTIGVRNDAPGVAIHERGKFWGFDVEIARRIAKELGAEPEYVALTRAELQHSVPGKDVDIALHALSINEAWQRTFAFAGPYYVAHQDVLVLRGGAVRNLADLDGKKLCVPAGSTSGGRVEDRVGGVKLVAGEHYHDCFERLQEGKVEAISADNMLLAGFASRLPDAYRLLGSDLTNERYGIAIPRGDKKACQAIHRVIRMLYQTGAVKRQVKKQFGKVEFTPELKVPKFVPCS